MGDIDIAPEDFSTVEMINVFIKRHRISGVAKTRYVNNEVEFLLQP